MTRARRDELAARFGLCPVASALDDEDDALAFALREFRDPVLARVAVSRWRTRREEVPNDPQVGYARCP